MKDSKIRKLVMAALLAALTYVATTVMQDPHPDAAATSTPATAWCC